MFKSTFFAVDDVFNNLEVDENDILYKEYRLKFIDLINQLKKDQIYKVVFRWESIDVDSFGYRKSNFNNTPSFFIYKDMDVDILWHKFVGYYNLIVNKYGFSEKINLDIFVKVWIKYGDLKSFDEILNYIK